MVHQACGSQHQEISILCLVTCIARKKQEKYYFIIHIYVVFFHELKKLKAT